MYSWKGIREKFGEVNSTKAYVTNRKFSASVAVFIKQSKRYELNETVAQERRCMQAGPGHHSLFASFFGLNQSIGKI
jgi:hypothetical protein